MGLVLLWSSNIWSTRDKVIGTLVFPGGLLPAFVLALTPSFSQDCISSGTFYLARRMRARSTVALA